MHDETHFEEVFQRGVLQVKACGCGMIHLGIGPVTLKLTREAFDQVRDGMQEAGSRLPSEKPPRGAAPYLNVVRTTVQ